MQKQISLEELKQRDAELLLFRRLYQLLSEGLPAVAITEELSEDMDSWKSSIESNKQMLAFRPYLDLFDGIAGNGIDESSSFEKVGADCLKFWGWLGEHAHKGNFRKLRLADALAGMIHILSGDDFARLELEPKPRITLTPAGEQLLGLRGSIILKRLPELAVEIEEVWERLPIELPAAGPDIDKMDLCQSGQEPIVLTAMDRDTALRLLVSRALARLDQQGPTMMISDDLASDLKKMEIWHSRWPKPARLVLRNLGTDLPWPALGSQFACAPAGQQGYLEVFRADWPACVGVWD